MAQHVNYLKGCDISYGKGWPVCCGNPEQHLTWTGWKVGGSYLKCAPETGSPGIIWSLLKMYDL